MKASVSCTTGTIEQTEAIVSDLKRAGLGKRDLFQRHHAENITTGSNAHAAAG